MPDPADPHPRLCSLHLVKAPASTSRRIDGAQQLILSPFDI